MDERKRVERIRGLERDRTGAVKSAAKRALRPVTPPSCKQSVQFLLDDLTQKKFL